MLSLRDPSPRLPQATGGPRCKDEPSSPRNLSLSPFQNAINSPPATDIAPVKTEDRTTDIRKTMDRRTEAGGSGSGSSNQYVHTLLNFPSIPLP
jgi:hypothetical protein